MVISVTLHEAAQWRNGSSCSTQDGYRPIITTPERGAVIAGGRVQSGAVFVSALISKPRLVLFHRHDAAVFRPAFSSERAWGVLF